MHISRIIKVVEKFTIDNSPLILTAVGVAGTLTTAVLTGKASYKAAEILAEHRYSIDDDHLDPMTTKYKIREVWKLYIPSLSVAAVTVTAIILSNRIGTRRAAALAAAYSIAEKGFDEYRDKIVEKLGANKEREARDEIAQDRVRAKSVGQSEVVLTGGGDILCFDAYTGRYFRSDMESIKQAMNNLNYSIINHQYASLNDFYDKVGLNHVEMGEEVGWNSDELLEIFFSATISDDQKPCISMEFRTKPIRNYFRTH